MWVVKTLDASIITHVKTSLRKIDKDRLIADHENGIQTQLDGAQKRLDRTEADIVKNGREIKKLKDEIMKALLGESTFSEATLSGMLKTKEQDAAVLAQKVEEARNEIFALDQELSVRRTMREEFKDWDSRFDAASDKDKRSMLLNVIERVILTDKETRIDFKYELHATTDNDPEKRRKIVDTWFNPLAISGDIQLIISSNGDASSSTVKRYGTAQ